MARALSEISEDIVIKPAPSGNATAAVVFLHGLGDTGHMLAEYFYELKIPHIKIICPTAGMHMPSWFDLYDLGEGEQPHCKEGLDNAAKEIHTLLDSEVLKGIEPSRVILGGISQGGVLALTAAYSYHSNFAGILALSTWIPYTLQSQLVEEMKSNKNTPVLQCHGDCDPTVKYSVGCKAAEVLKSFNPDNHDFKTYKGLRHWVCPQEMLDIKEYITKLLPDI